MKSIDIYMEGGGRSRNSRALLREGVEAFLEGPRDAAKKKGLQLRIVCCGGRGEARAEFLAAKKEAECSALLLVDSEVAVSSDVRTHLVTEDGWTDLEHVPVEEMHLMVQVMETWIVADMPALREHYGPGFRVDKLPVDEDLEAVAKGEIVGGLERASENTPHGGYHKVHHARRLLAKIDPEKVQARCPHCRLLFEALISMIEAA